MQSKLKTHCLNILFKRNTLKWSNVYYDAIAIHVPGESLVDLLSKNIFKDLFKMLLMNPFSH